MLETSITSIRKGIWLFEPSTLTLMWAGECPAPKPTLVERISMAIAHIRSKGHGVAFIPAIKRLANAIAFCLKSPQVSLSGNSNDTTPLCGSTIEEAWLNFSLTECVPQHTGHGNKLSFEARSSR